MRKGRILIASVILATLMVAATGAWALNRSHDQVRTEALLDRAGAICQTPDSPGCAEILNQIEPGA